jgi:hypothetical protein
MEEAKELPPLPSLLALHRYYIWANRHREYFFRAALKDQGDRPMTALTVFADDAMMFMSYWYAGLYVVVEGWGELRLNDPKVDELLESPHVDLLRRYRNGVCHYQREYADPRFLDMISAQGVVPWVQDLNQAFGSYFMQRLKEDPDGWLAKMGHPTC